MFKKHALVSYFKKIVVLLYEILVNCFAPSNKMNVTTAPITTDSKRNVLEFALTTAVVFYGVKF